MGRIPMALLAPKLKREMEHCLLLGGVTGGRAKSVEAQRGERVGGDFLGVCPKIASADTRRAGAFEATRRRRIGINEVDPAPIRVLAVSGTASHALSDWGADDGAHHDDWGAFQRRGHSSGATIGAAVFIDHRHREC